MNVRKGKGQQKTQRSKRALNTRGVMMKSWGQARTLRHRLLFQMETTFRGKVDTRENVPTESP